MPPIQPALPQLPVAPSPAPCPAQPGGAVVGAWVGYMGMRHGSSHGPPTHVVEEAGEAAAGRWAEEDRQRQ